MFPSDRSIKQLHPNLIILLLRNIQSDIRFHRLFLSTDKNLFPLISHSICWRNACLAASWLSARYTFAWHSALISSSSQGTIFTLPLAICSSTLEKSVSLNWKCAEHHMHGRSLNQGQLPWPFSQQNQSSQTAWLLKTACRFLFAVVNGSSSSWTWTERAVIFSSFFLIVAVKLFNQCQSLLCCKLPFLNKLKDSFLFLLHYDLLPIVYLCCTQDLNALNHIPNDNANDN